MPDRITELNEKLWDSRAHTYDRNWGFNRWSQKKLLSLLDLSNEPYLLEIACGTGWALRYARSITHGHGQFYGLDIASRMIEQAKIKSAAFENIHFVRANAEKVPFNDSFFKYVICTNAFHHFANPVGVIRESSRVLKPGGHMYIADATGDGFFMRLVDKLERILQPGYVKAYSTKEYQAFFEEAGLAYLTRQTIVSVLKIHIARKVG